MRPIEFQVPFREIERKEARVHSRHSLMQYATCRHLKEDGIYCGSPALHGRSYCYHHLSLRGRRLRRAQARRCGQPYRLQLPPLDNLRAVQTALTEVLEALAEGQP